MKILGDSKGYWFDVWHELVTKVPSTLMTWLSAELETVVENGITEIDRDIKDALNEIV